ncbi:hypothetical protein GCM10027445_26170 [Amycolatopsis endophytica]|uniref:Uncharacterized protein n=1 Tax=Amycolatopsis endophytica TaxID=860233 RepID=A0A853BAT8_9PSEU|nr:hypothetical protein [Amycolatopsis endophytica]NYI92289.1 hypothetical protein [Amycolatopsis endophytica]
MTARNKPTAIVRERASVSGAALLILLALLFLGLFALAIATDAVPNDEQAVAFAPAFYGVTVMVGLVASCIGFTIFESVLERSADPLRHWIRTGWALIAPVVAAFVGTGLLINPAVALGIAATSLGVGISLLWSVPRSRHGTRAFLSLLWTSLALTLAAAGWVTITIHDSLR